MIHAELLLVALGSFTMEAMVISIADSIDPKPGPAQARAGGLEVQARFDAGTSDATVPSSVTMTNDSQRGMRLVGACLTESDCSNQQFSITAVTTSAGAVTERYAYSAYGLPTILDASASVITSSAISNRYTYTGREWDATLALHHFRARWMSPIAGRFLSRDPIGFRGSPYLLYQFLDGKALVGLDPTGQERVEVRMAEFRACLAKSVAARDQCLCDASEAARICVKTTAEEAWRQFVLCDNTAAAVRDAVTARCAIVNDRNTLIGEIGYQSCVGAALAMYSAASTACAATYIAAEARIAAACLTFETGRAIACGILYVDRNGDCDDKLSRCLRR